MPPEKTGLLYGKKAIMEYLDISQYILNKLVDAGMPVIRDKSNYIAHKDNLEAFLRGYTSCQAEKNPKLEGKTPGRP
jgi:hypothetical protein